MNRFLLEQGVSVYLRLLTVMQVGPSNQYELGHRKGIAAVIFWETDTSLPFHKAHCFLAPLIVDFLNAL